MFVQCPALILCLQALKASSLVIETPANSSPSQYHNLSLNTTQAFNGTDKYYVECLALPNPRQPKLSTSSCDTAIYTICSRLSFPQPRITNRGRWQWTSLPGCSLGYFIPDDAPSSLIPFEEECEQEIFGRMIKQCGSDPRYNIGTINVDYPPTPMMPGFPVTAGYPRYIMAPSELDVARSS